MPTVPISTRIPQKEYEIFRKKGEEMGVSDYSLAQDYIIFCNHNSYVASHWVKIKQAAKENLRLLYEILDAAP